MPSPPPDNLTCPSCGRAYLTMKGLLMHRAASECGANPLKPFTLTRDDERYLRSLRITPKEAVNE